VGSGRGTGLKGTLRFTVAVFAALVLAVGPGVASIDRAPAFRHVVVILFENKEYGAVIGSGHAPTFDALARRYALLTQSYAVAHPSLPNYLALVSGSTHGITNDCTTCFVAGPSLADTVEAAGKTWKTYAEGLPRAGYTGPAAGRYVMKHVPFLYFRDVRKSPSRRARVVPLPGFGSDLAARRLPDYSLVVPDLCHSMHDCSIETGDAWLRSFLKPLLRSSELARSLVLVTFDEGSSSDGGGGHVATLALGPLVRRGAGSARRITTYGLLRTIEDGLGLPRLGASRSAGPITGIWR
jgi:phosphatidylinositol-3-phosphatase